MRASPDVLLGTIAVHLVHYKVAGDTAKEGIGCDVATKVTKLPGVKKISGKRQLEEKR